MLLGLVEGLTYSLEGVEVLTAVRGVSECDILLNDLIYVFQDMLEVLRDLHGFLANGYVLLVDGILFGLHHLLLHLGI